MSRSDNLSKKRQPSATARKRVASMFNADVLKDMCDRIDLPSWAGRERFYYYKDNGSNILAVAHLDTVQEDCTCSVMQTSAGLLAASGGLDDRLGVYVILDLLPRLGMVFDILLTTDEEIGQSTAGEFETSKQYDWIIQFDRGGTDVVMYDYETPELCERVEACGARVGTGSFSDICMLDDLGVAGFNWGIGYQDYHSQRSHAWLDDTFRMVARFEKFHRANKGTRFDHVKVDRWSWQDDYRDQERDDRKWGWDSFIQADCGHVVDLEDDSDYVEADQELICTECAESRNT